MSKIDAFYTPPELAAQMVNVCSIRPNVIADFASGDGELLRAASKRWSKAKLIATDISKTALTALCDGAAATEVGHCNFLSQRSRLKCSVLSNWAGKIDLALLNPPFSCRGGKRIPVSTNSFRTTCSIAMAFVLQAFEYLHRHGEIIAIIPAGSASSEKDREAWKQLREQAAVEIMSEHDHRTFGSCFPTTTLVRIRKGKVKAPLPLGDKQAFFKGPLHPPKPVVIHRGTVQMHSIPAGRVPLAHSTDLTSFRLVLNGHKTKSGHSMISGSFIAISRVGNPQKEKIALHHATSAIAISDCILAVRCNSKAQASRLHSQIVSNWPKLSSLYGGTGAKYITVSKLSGFIKQLGFQVAPHANAKWQLKRSVAESVQI
jgi:Methyltransferase small domain